MVNRNCGGEVSCPHVGITSLLLGDPWWGCLTKQKKLKGYAHFVFGQPQQMHLRAGSPKHKKSRTNVRL